jgi:hypothetical protein
MLIATQVQNYLQHGGYRVAAKTEKRNKKAYMEMDEGRGEVVLALVEKNFGHLPQHQSLLLLLHDERC